jgi:hypothetical protein
LSVPAGPELYRCPALREPPQHRFRKLADFVGDGFADECGESVGTDVRNYARDNIALAADSADNRRFAGADATGAAASAAVPRQSS